MTTEWYLEKSGQWVGTFSSEQLRELALAGKLKKDDKLRRGESDQSILAGKVKNLFSDDKRKGRPKQPPPALPKSFLSTPPPIPETSQSKTPPPLPSKLNTTEKDKIEKEPRSRLLMLVWLAALSFCIIFIAYMLPNERKQVIKWLSKKTDSFVENLSKESKEDVKPKSVSQDATSQAGSSKGSPLFDGKGPIYFVLTDEERRQGWETPETSSGPYLAPAPPITRAQYEQIRKGMSRWRVKEFLEGKPHKSHFESGLEADGTTWWRQFTDVYAGEQKGSIVVLIFRRGNHDFTSLNSAIGREPLLKKMKRGL